MTFNAYSTLEHKGFLDHLGELLQFVIEETGPKEMSRFPRSHRWG